MLSPTRLPLILAVVSALFWGLWWIPIWMLENLGLSGLWPGTLINLGGALIFMMASALVLGQMKDMTAGGLMGALIGGFSVALYGWALAETQVAKAVLLFYLTPIWSLLLERMFFGKRLSPFALCLVALAFVGIGFLFDWQFDFTTWTLGDTCALLAGMTWSGSLMFIFSARTTQPSLPLSALILLGAALTGLVLLALPSFRTDASLVFTPQVALLAVLFGALYLGPTLWMTMWVANRLAPSILCLLLTAEIVAALVTSAWLKGEAFGIFQFIGSVLVVGSGTALGLSTAITPPAPERA